MAQPNASRVVAELELTTQTMLLDRRPRGSTPTSSGILFADRAREVLDSARCFTDWIRTREGTAVSELRIGASMTIAENLLPAWLTELRRQQPNVRVDVQVLNSTQVLERVREGTLQLGFVETPHVPVGLNTQVVQEDELVVVVAAGHGWSTRHGKISRDELAATALVVREPGSGTREALGQLLSGFVGCEPAQVLTSNAAVRVAVASGAGPAVLSELAVHDQLANGELLRVPVDGPRVGRPLAAAWPGPQRLTGAAAKLVTIASSPRR